VANHKGFNISHNQAPNCSISNLDLPTLSAIALKEALASSSIPQKTVLNFD